MSQLLYVPARYDSLSMCVLYVLLQLLQKVCAVPNEKCHVSVAYLADQDQINCPWVSVQEMEETHEIG